MRAVGCGMDTWCHVDGAVTQQSCLDIQFDVVGILVHLPLNIPLKIEHDAIDCMAIEVLNLLTLPCQFHNFQKAFPAFYLGEHHPQRMSQLWSKHVQ